MAEGFTKLFNTIITSTIWQEDDKTRLLWITMLALADFEGNVFGSLPGIAYQTHISIKDCEKALKKLSEPDKYSRSKEYEGRRIQEIDGGWQILNYTKYRSLKVDRKAYLRKKQQEHRKKERNKEKIEKNNTHTNTHTHSVNTVSTNVDGLVDKLSIHPTEKQVKDECFKQGMTDQDGERIHAHYQKKSWVDGAGQPLTDLISTVTAWRLNPRRQIEQQSKPVTIHEQAERLRKAGEL